jgi:hypothetical protein
MKKILLSVVADILEAFGFATLEQHEAMIDRCWRRSVELADAQRAAKLSEEAAERMFVARNVARDQAKRLREFVVEIAAETHPNTKTVRLMINDQTRLHRAAMEVLTQTREPEQL